MDHDRPVAGTCAKGTLWWMTRAGCLVLAAILATILLIELPIPVREAEAPPYVPASETWIEPGRDRPQSDPQASVTLTPSHVVR